MRTPEDQSSDRDGGVVSTALPFGMNPAPSKDEVLSRYKALQSRWIPLLAASNTRAAAGQLTAAATSLGEVVDVLQQQLDLVELNNGEDDG